MFPQPCMTVYSVVIALHWLVDLHFSLYPDIYVTYISMGSGNLLVCKSSPKFLFVKWIGSQVFT